jgi:fructokinase
MTAPRPPEPSLRIGIDLGGTKIAAIALGPTDQIIAELRARAPRDDYRATIAAIRGLIADIERSAGGVGTIGLGMPGSMSPVTGLVQGANSTWLNGKPFGRDLEARLGRPVRLANDANCFALSEASDGAAAGARSVFGVIIGTGCGGGLVIDGRLLDGPNAIGGEWGHNPLPWPREDELAGPQCWCGRRGCMETWVSGPAISRDHESHTGETVSAEDIASRGDAGDPAAQATLARHASRLARGIAHVVNIVDPEVIVLGGGLSKLATLYAELPALAAPHVFAARPRIDIRPPRWGDASGVRGAARLWQRRHAPAMR